MNKRVFALLIVFVGSFLLTTCDPISLKQTIENLVLGWQAAVILTSPTNEELRAEKTPLLDWEDLGGAAGYEVQINNINDFDGIESINVTESQYEISETLTVSDERYWRVRAVNSDRTGGEWSDVWSFLIAPSESPEIIYSQNIGGSPYVLVYDSGYCYIPAGTPGLKVFDVTDPANPEDITIPAFTAFDDAQTPVAIKDQYLYLVNVSGNDSLYIYDITDPAAPMQVGSTMELLFDPDQGGPIGDENFSCSSAESLIIWGSDLYALGRFPTPGRGVLYIDIDNPLSPNIQDFVSLSDSAEDGFDLNINGNYGYATVNNVGVDIFRFIGTFELISTYDISSTPMAYGFVQFKDNYAIVTDQNGPCVILDILDPTNPTYISTFNPGEGTAGGYVQGIFSFVGGTSSQKMHVVDIRDIANPELMHSIEGESSIINHVEGNYAYGVDYYTGTFYVIDLVPEG